MDEPLDEPTLPVFGVAMSEPRRRRFHEQLAGIPLSGAPCGALAACSASSCRYPRCAAGAALVPSGLAPFMRLPPPEAATLTRARLAQAIAERVAANGNVTHEELVAAGFDAADIAAHFRGALRAARVERMAV